MSEDHPNARPLANGIEVWGGIDKLLAVGLPAGIRDAKRTCPSGGGSSPIMGSGSAAENLASVIANRGWQG
jgi:hypothetical protein